MSFIAAFGLAIMTFEQALATQPAWIQIWVSWMGIALTASMIALAFSRTTRRDAAIILAVTVPLYFSMMWLYEQVGYVRLLGIVHVVFWTPLALYLWRRLQDPAIVTPFRQVIWIVLATITISLAFDYVDVARYALGERESLVG
jgi:hypothetical protein